MLYINQTITRTHAGEHCTAIGCRRWLGMYGYPARRNRGMCINVQPTKPTAHCTNAMRTLLCMNAIIFRTKTHAHEQAGSKPVSNHWPAVPALGPPGLITFAHVRCESPARTARANMRMRDKESERETPRWFRGYKVVRSDCRRLRPQEHSGSSTASATAAATAATATTTTTTTITITVYVHIHMRFGHLR